MLPDVLENMKPMFPQNTSQFPWEIDRDLRGTWTCTSCSTTAPMWDAGSSFTLCCRCALEALEHQRAKIRTQIKADRAINEYRAAICIGNPEALHETEKALLYQFADGRRRWVPKSVIISADQDGVRVKPWFARKELRDAA